MESLQDLFLDELKDTLHAEKQLLKALPKMAKAAKTPELRQAFQTHAEETQVQVERLEQIFELIGAPAKAKPCKGMAGIIEEGKDMMDEAEDQDTLEALLIGSAQKAEHYEIASYGTLKSYAELMGNEEVAELLEQTLNEEKETDQKLTELAESFVNVEAAEGDEEEGAASSGGRGKSSGGKSSSKGRGGRRK